MLQAKNLTINYSRLIFQDVSFLLGNKEKVGLVGLNGCGKSTLLKILSGEEIPDKGEIILQNEHIEYLPQEFTFDSELLVGEFFESLVNNDSSQLWRVKKILNLLELGELDDFTLVDVLSPGQKMKLYLAKLLIKEPTVLLLDEPTNHLDIEGITWFEKFIKKFDGICIIISHDREFLNNTVNKIFEIDENSLYVYEGNYDDYLIQKEEFKAKCALMYKMQERKREQLENLLELSRKIGDAKKRSAAVSSAKKRMKREVLDVEIDKYKEQRIQALKLEGQVHNSKQILKIKALNFGYHKDTLLLKNLDFQMYGKEKVWLYGPNGIGKSTFIKLITGELKPQSGDIKIGENLRWTYFTQDQSSLDPQSRLQDYFIKETGVSFSQSFGLLEKFLFPKELFKTQIQTLSPGQRARLIFAIFAQKEYEFLILDEPTNHLDIQTKEVIERSLAEFEGAILLISHDRYFVREVGINRVVTLRDGDIVEHHTL